MCLLNWVLQGNWDLIVTLLNNNADPLIHNNKNYGAHALAYFNNHKEQSQYIAEVALRRAILASDLHSMMLMIQDGANVNLQTDQGATALIVAAHAGQAGVVRWLLAVPGIMPDFQVLCAFKRLVCFAICDMRGCCGVRITNFCYAQRGLYYKPHNISATFFIVTLSVYCNRSATGGRH